MTFFQVRKTWRQHFDPYFYSLFLQNRLYSCKIGSILGNVLALSDPPDFAKNGHFLFKLNTKMERFLGGLVLGD